MSVYAWLPIQHDRVKNKGFSSLEDILMDMMGFRRQGQYHRYEFWETVLVPAYKSVVSEFSFEESPASCTITQHSRLRKVNDYIPKTSAAYFDAVFVTLRDVLRENPEKGEMLSALLNEFKATNSIPSYSDFCFPWLGQCRNVLSSGDKDQLTRYPDLNGFVRSMEELANKTDKEWRAILK